MIKTIIFDIGGVVTHMDFDLLYSNFAKRIGIDPQIVVDYHKENLRAMILGALSFEDLCSAMRDIGANPSLNFKKEWTEEATKIRMVNKELLDIISNLRKNYSVGVLSNVTESRLILDENINLYDNFDYSILSCKEGRGKPDLEFYKMALNTASVKPEEAIFIDDQERYLIPARELGMKTINYSNNDRLKEDLKEMGISIKP